MVNTYFTLSKKSNYAIRALFELALRGPSEPVNVRVLAGAQDIPVRFLEIILNELKQGGFVISVRGKAGGYLLSKPAAEMTVGQVVCFLENAPDLEKPAFEQTHPGEYVFKKLMNEVNRRVDDVFGCATLEEMVREYMDNQEMMASNYVI